MYRLTKPNGRMQTITLTNEETSKSVNLGLASFPILNILAEHEDLKTSGDSPSLSLREEWNIIVKDETAKLLSATTMKMHKPVKTKKDDTKEAPSEQKPKKREEPVDLFDLIYGINNKDII